MNCHTLMMQKKKLIWAKLKGTVSFKIFNTFWKVYYPKPIKQPINDQQLAYWNQIILTANLLLFTSTICPFCIASFNCKNCQYGNIFGQCDTRSSSFSQAMHYWNMNIRPHLLTAGILVKWEKALLS